MTNMISALRQKIRWHQHVRRSRHDLNGMADYLLKDMGISRPQIDYYASRTRNRL